MLRKKESNRTLFGNKHKQLNDVNLKGTGNIDIGSNSKDISINQTNSHNKFILSLKGLFNIIFIEGKANMTDDALLVVQIEEIRKKMNENQNKQALVELNQLQNSIIASGKQLSTNDRFSILLNMYICYIRLEETETERSSLEHVIQTELNNAKEFYKFKYLLALGQLKENNKYTKDVIVLCQEILDVEPDYYKAKMLMLIAQSVNGDITFDSSIAIIDDLIFKYMPENLDKVNAIVTKGDISLNLKQYDYAIQFYKEALQLKNRLSYKVGVAMAYYLKATKNAESNGYIKFTKIDFDSLHQARVFFEEIYEEATQTNNKVILKEMLLYYLNSLQFTEESQQILDLRRESSNALDLNNREMAIISAQAEIFTGEISHETLEKLSGIDRIKIEIKQLAIKNNYDGVYNIILPYIDNEFRNDEPMIAMYLISLFKTNRLNFISEFKRYRDIFKGEVEYDLIWVLYLEYIKEIDDASEHLKELIIRKPEPIIIMDGYIFYERNNLSDDLFELSLKIVENQLHVRSTDLKYVLKKHFFMLIDRENYTEAEKYYGELDLTIFKEVDQLRLQIEFHKLMGHLQEQADLTIEYGKKIKDDKYLVYGASLYAVTNQLEKAIRLLEELRKSGRFEKSELYIALSKLYFLANDNEKAFECAYKSKEIDKDLYKSPSHSYYVIAGLRANKVDDVTSHMIEFHENFPKEDWIRSGNILMKDEEGNDILDYNEFQKLIGDRSGYNEVKNAFLDYRLGISSYMQIINDINLDFIFAELRFLKKKIKICEGNIRNINQGSKIIKNRILVDSIALYIMADAGILNILEEFEEVQVSYVTYELLQTMLMQNESENIRVILKFISDSYNIKLVAIQQSLFMKSDIYLEETIVNLNYSHKNKIPYLTGEFNLRNAFEVEGEFVVDVPTMLTALSERDTDTRKICTKCIEKLLSKDYTFISFTLLNIIDTFEELINYTNIKNEFGIYLSMSRFSDYNSFINIYMKFLNYIKDKIEQEDYLNFVEMIFEYLDWYTGKTLHYYSTLEPLVKRLPGSIYYFNSKILCTSVLMLSTQLDSVQWDKRYIRISKSFSFNNYHIIVISIMSGLYAFLMNYKDNVNQLNYYKDFFNKKFSNIDYISVEAVFKLVTKEK